MKKIISIVLLITILFGTLFILAGCDNTGNKEEDTKNKTEISYTLGNGVFTVSVPKNEEGNAKYEFTKEKPEQSTKTGSFYLVTDNTVFSFSTERMTYNTSVKFKEKNGEQKATFDGYLEWMKDPDSSIKLSGMEQFELNGRKALRYHNKEGSSSNYKYYGYFYLIGVDDIYEGSRADVTVNYLDEELPTEAREFDAETLSIINSLKITLKETK